MSAWVAFLLVAAVLGLAAVACVAVPLWRDRERPASTAALTASSLVIPALAALIYLQSSNHEWAHAGLATGESGPAPSVEDLIAPLRERLEKDPDDPRGWMLLGASYTQIGNYTEAAAAFDRVLSLTSGRDTDALMGKAEALILQDPERLLQEAGELVEQVLLADPSNPKGLWYGGLRASARGEDIIAVRRWRSMLEGPVTPDVRAIVERELNRLGASVATEQTVASAGQLELRLRLGPPASPPAGAVLFVFARMGASVATEQTVASAGQLELRLRLGPPASPPAGAVLFVFARIPGQAGPPLAVKRVDGARFPLTVSLGDADAMLPGATISDQSELAITARLSASGQTSGGAGDYEAQAVWQAGQGPLELELLLQP